MKWIWMILIIILFTIPAVADVAGTLKVNPKNDGEICAWSVALPGIACNVTSVPSADVALDVNCTNCVALTTETSGNYVSNVATSSPLSGGSAGSEGASLTIAIDNAAADGSTKGAASFTANDFDASSGNISIDYTNGQAASTSTKGYLTSTDWNTFNGKLSTGTAVSNIDLGNQPLCYLRPQGNEPPASSFATPDTRNSHPTLRFNGNVCAIWTCVLSGNYQGNGVTAAIWYASTETSNDTDWDGSWERIEASQDVDSDSFATAVSADNNNNNGTSGIPTKVAIAFTNGAQMDSCAAGELCRFRLCRDDTGDTGGADTIDYLGGLVYETP